MRMSHCLGSEVQYQRGLPILAVPMPDELTRAGLKKRQACVVCGCLVTDLSTLTFCETVYFPLDPQKFQLVAEGSTATKVSER